MSPVRIRVAVCGRAGVPREVSGKACRWGRVVSIEMKSDLNGDLHADGLAILRCRLKLPLFYRRDCSGIQSVSQATHQTNVTRVPLLIDDQPQHARSLRLRGARFFRVLRVGS